MRIGDKLFFPACSTLWHITDLPTISLREPVHRLKWGLFPSCYESPFEYHQREGGMYLQLNESYSSCSLTFVNDKMPALTGMIQSIRKRHGVTFNGGIWLNFPHESLLWYRLKVGEMRPLEDLKFPSWTWAAYEGTIQYLQPTTTPGDFHPDTTLKLVLGEDSESALPLSAPMTLTGRVRKLHPDVQIVVDRELLSLIFSSRCSITDSDGRDIC